MASFSRAHVRSPATAPHTSPRTPTATADHEAKLVVWIIDGDLVVDDQERHVRSMVSSEMFEDASCQS